MNPDTSNTIFQKAVSFVNQTNRHLFITGKAGTGKTTFLKYIKEHTFKKMAVVAPTGVAAINAGGVTIHSFFQLPFGPFLPTDKALWGSFGGEVNNRASLLKNLRLPGAKRQVIQELDLLVIDEVSMVRADLLDAMDTVMRFVRKQPLTPFGGVQIVYIGDLFQLPPVVRNEEWEILQEHYRSPFFFDAQALNVVSPLYLELKKIYRQKDDVFINILNNIRNNTCTKDDLQLLDTFYNPGFSPAEDENFITLTSHNNKADTINQRELEKLPGKLFTYPAKITGEFSDRSFPADKDLLLKEGAQIMFLKNDKGENRRFYNGKIGIVKRIEPEKIVVTFAREDDELELELETWENIRYNYKSENDSLEEEQLGTFSQFPIRLAWAITIHKSQGLTFEKAVIDAGASFAAGQVYVSLSRLTGLKGLVLHSRILPHCISTDNRVVDFVQQELADDALEQILLREQKVYVRQSLLQSFTWQKIMDMVNDNLESYDHRVIPNKDKCIVWANGLVEVVKNQHDVAEKFKKQLEFLFVTAEDNDYKKLRERTNAATKYFITDIDDKLLSPLKQHIEEMKVKKKVLKYLKELDQLFGLITRKKQQVEQAAQLSQALSEKTNLDDLLRIVELNKKSEPPEVPAEVKVKSGKAEKGESGRITLQMFKQGKTIADIATERELAASTIEGHLAAFVTTGEVDVLDLVSNEMVEKLIVILEAEPEMPYSAIKEKVGEDVSYGTIRAVINFMELMKKEAIKYTFFNNT